MSDIQSVAIAGASGTLGPHVLKALVDAKFRVKVLVRPGKPRTFDPDVDVSEVDFESVGSLTAALQGVDAVVSTISGRASMMQFPLIDAAAAAGVKRFIPSDFGGVTFNPELKSIPLYENVWKIKAHLQEKVDAGQFSWTVLACGAFLEYVFPPSQAGLLELDFAQRKAVLFDEGDNRVTLTSLPTIGVAVAGILKNVEATKNKLVKVSEVIVTQNQVLRIAGKLQPDEQWETSKIASKDLLQKGLDAYNAGELTPLVVMNIVRGTGLAGEKYGGAYNENDNELLGVRELTERDLEKIVVQKLP